MRLLPHRRWYARNPLTTLIAAFAAVLGTLVVMLGTIGTAQADTQICDQYGTTTIQGKYVVMNNRWGTSEQQCINVTSSGFRITTANGSVPTNGAPKSYPAVYNGCHYTNCSPGTNLPAQLSNISSAPTSVSYSYVSNAVYDAAYDIWLDPTARKDGVNRTEIMVWLNRVGSIQPVGSSVGSVSVGGRSWDLWSGSNGSNDVLSFVASSAVSSYSFDVMDFARVAVSRGKAQNDWYLTSVQAGFEPWQNGAGLAVNNFSSSVNLGGGGTNGGTTNGGTDGGSTGGTPPGGCDVTYATQTWTGGFTANVTVRNGGSSAVSNWQLGFTLPSGQLITNTWNATISPSSGSVTARGMSYNANLAAGASTSFGFQGTYSGTFSKPSSFTLNGTTCRVA